MKGTNGRERKAKWRKMDEEKSEIYLFVKTCLLFAYHTVCVMQESFTNFSFLESFPYPFLFYQFVSTKLAEKKERNKCNHSSCVRKTSGKQNVARYVVATGSELKRDDSTSKRSYEV